MRRGERKAWRELRDAAEKIAASTDYAEEYLAKIEYDRILRRLGELQTVKQPGMRL